MRHLTRRSATAAAVAAALTGAVTVAAPAASAVTPGTSFLYGALSCQALVVSGNDGRVTCTGTQQGNWRAKVKCSAGFTYYGNWQSNFQGGTRSSTADSNCFWSVEDITITSS
ncbi:hypothetical protein [Saccharothrix syringae]|uniref:Streptomyces killer toxin-like beta/gamma crystallin domain-containing protein n=1 Tax=Saccharothrix syringae TaxID=103733 RepID=A0A5Q0GXW5_SACSY|nr:hypothetical protein [Saccharothrix syringae]QFZ18344.1 hypothetical protein EKG83_13380 [Saccharothrix syringae]